MAHESDGKVPEGSRERPMTFYPRFSNLPRAANIPRFDQELLDTSGFPSLTVEVTDTQDLLAWDDPESEPEAWKEEPE